MDSTMLSAVFAQAAASAQTAFPSSSDSVKTDVSFSEILTGASAKVTNNPFTDISADKTDGKSALFDALKEAGAADLSTALQAALKNVLKGITNDEFTEKDAQDLVNSLLNGSEDANAEDLPEKWAGLSLEDSKKLLKIIDLLNYAAADKNKSGENMQETVIDMLFGDKKKGEKAAESGLIMPDSSYMWQIMAVRLSQQTSPETLTENFTAVQAMDMQMPDTAQTADAQIIPENTAEILKNAVNSMSSDDLAERLDTFAEALNAEITVKNGGNAEASEDIFTEMQTASLRKDKTASAEGELAAITADVPHVVNTGDVVQVNAQDVKFSDIAAQIERVLKTEEIFAKAAEKTPTELTIRLDPENLGRIEVKITSGNGGLTVAFAAESAQTGRLLSENVRELAAAVNRAGGDINEVYVVSGNESTDGAQLSMAFSFANSFGGGQKDSGANQTGRQITPAENTENSVSETENITLREGKLWQTA